MEAAHGAIGTQCFRRTHCLPSKSEGDLAPGSRLRIETPGGGGLGLP